MSLSDRARENAAENDAGEWGYRVELDVGASFEGRYRGETTTTSDYGEQRVFLFWDRDGALCFMYGKTRLARKLDSLQPNEGDSIAIARIDDELSQGRRIFRFGVAVEPNFDALPTPPVEARSSYVPPDDDPPW
jgi:hypothetical protein